jgi:crossover junction endodeoxyribonuclease RuvC
MVLGVDPGTIRTGWGLVTRTGTRFSSPAAGVIEAGKQGELPDRLHTIYRELREIIEQHRPEVMAVEDIFFARSAAAALKLGHARGAVLLAAAEAGIGVCAYSPALVKRSVAGRGQAQKNQVARIIGAILGLKKLPPTDATDALAIAITHLNAARFNK